MATRAPVTIEEYLRTGEYERSELVDGQIVERSMPKDAHSKAQVRLVLLLARVSERTPLHIRTELTVQTAPSRYRIIDVSAYTGKEPAEETPASPPYIAVEIVSPDDRYTRLIEKLQEYRAWGVAHVWLVDPWLPKTYVYDERGLNDVPAFRVPELELEINLTDIVG